MPVSSPYPGSQSRPRPPIPTNLTSRPFCCRTQTLAQPTRTRPASASAATNSSLVSAESALLQTPFTSTGKSSASSRRTRSTIAGAARTKGLERWWTRRDESEWTLKTAYHWGRYFYSRELDIVRTWVGLRSAVGVWGSKET